MNRRFFTLGMSLLIVVVAVVNAHAKTCKVSILHFNDTHGYLNEHSDHVGGAARMAAFIEKLRQKNEKKGRHTLVLHGGDLISGTMLSARYKGEAEYTFLDMIGTDAMVIGNHEFDLGRDAFLRNSRKVSFPALSSNIVRKGSKRPFTQASHIIQYADGCRVGIIGATTETTPTATMPEHVNGLSFINADKAVTQTLADIQKETDVQIALTHLGVMGDVALAEAVPGLDAVIGGHDHVQKKDACRKVEGIPVCQAPAKARYLGRVDIDVTDDAVRVRKMKTYKLRRWKKEDPRILAMVAKYNAELDSFKGEVVGTLSQPLENVPEDDGYKQTYFGKYIAKTLHDSMNVDIGFINSGGVRKSLSKGPVTQQDMFEVFPFGNKVVVVTLTGKHIRTLVETGYERVQRGRSSFNWYNVTFDLKNGNVENIRVDGKPLRNSNTYTLATVDFLVLGGDGASILKGVPYRETGTPILDVVSARIQNESK